MKRWIAILLVFAVTIGLSACRYFMVQYDFHKIGNRKLQYRAAQFDENCEKDKSPVRVNIPLKTFQWTHLLLISCNCNYFNRCIV